MKIISWNVNGIRACSKKGFWDFFNAEDADVFCVQETKAHPDQLKDEYLHPEGRVGHYSSGRKKGYSGTATFLKNPAENFERGIGIKKFDYEGRFVITHHKDFVLYNVYFPNGGMREERHLFKQEFLRKFTDHLVGVMSSGKEVIVVGDYNVAYLDIDVYDSNKLANESGFLPEERDWFKQFLECGFVDVFRHFHPDQKNKYTWWSYKENGRIGNRGWRIDHMCVSKGLIDRVKSIEILDEQEGSDHCPLRMEIKC